jgi:hypothetical protein
MPIIPDDYNEDRHKRIDLLVLENVELKEKLRLAIAPAVAEVCMKPSRAELVKDNERLQKELETVKSKLRQVGVNDIVNWRTWREEAERLSDLESKERKRADDLAEQLASMSWYPVGQIKTLAEENERLKSKYDLMFYERQSALEDNVELREQNRVLQIRVDGGLSNVNLLMKGMESQCELMDGLKQETRKQKGEIESLLQHLDLLGKIAKVKTDLESKEGSFTRHEEILKEMEEGIPSKTMFEELKEWADKVDGFFEMLKCHSDPEEENNPDHDISIPNRVIFDTVIGLRETRPDV